MFLSSVTRSGFVIGRPKGLRLRNIVEQVIGRQKGLRLRNIVEQEPSGENPSEKKEELNVPLFSDSLGVRTRDPNIKSVVLYQLS